MLMDAWQLLASCRFIEQKSTGSLSLDRQQVYMYMYIYDVNILIHLLWGDSAATSIHRTGLLGTETKKNHRLQMSNKLAISPTSDFSWPRFI